MNYGGFYEKAAIEQLRYALRSAYVSRLFMGGRGFSCGGASLIYVNMPHPNDFGKFEGREEIFNTGTGISLGFHEYWGMSLL